VDVNVATGHGLATGRTVAELVGRARARVESLPPDAVEYEVAAGAVLVDVREADECERSGRIAGSLLVPRGMLEFRADPEGNYHDARLRPHRRIICYCASGGRSALAAAALLDLGYHSVAHLDGGLAAWQEAGKPVV
jgi:rhodanese-related sulfurtransferase